MFIFLKLTALIFIIVAFGWHLVKIAVKDKKITVLLALGPATGIIFYLFFLDVASRFIPIQLNFYLLLGVMAALAIVFWRISRKSGTLVEIDLPKKWLYALIMTAIFVSAWAGFVAMRGLFYDTTYTNHIPTAVTVAEGNFPIKNIESPIDPLKYHYSSELFAAAVYKITGAPIWRCYDVSIFFTVFGIFMMAYLLAWQLSKNKAVAYLAAIVTIYGGGLMYLHAFDFFKNIFKKVFLKEETAGFFSFLPKMINGDITNPVISTVNHHYVAFGFLAALVFIYIYIRLIDEGLVLKKWPLILIGAIAAGFLPIASEMIFGVIVIALVFYPAVLFVIKRKFEADVKSAIMLSVIFLAISVPIALTGGGLTSIVGQRSYLSSEFIMFGKNFNILPLSLDDGWSPLAPAMRVLSWDFVKNFGLPLAFFVPALWFLRRRVPHIWFFGMLAVISGCIPIFVYYDFPHEILRFFFFSTLLINFIFSLFVGFLLSDYGKNKKIKIFSYLLVILAILPGIIFEIAYSVVPLKKIDDIPHEFYYIKDYFSTNPKYEHKLFSELPAPSEADREAIGWIKENTNVGDIFYYPMANPVYYDNIIDFDKLKFIVFSGRMAPDYHYGSGYIIPPPNQFHNYNLIRQSCSPDILRQLGFDYLYVSPRWPIGLEEMCINTGGIKKVFEGENKGEFRRIYKISD